MTNALQKYIGHKFASSEKGLHEFKCFHLAYIKALMAIAENNAWKLVRTGDAGRPGYFQFSIFMMEPDTKKIAYIQIPDVRYSPEGWHEKILVREAASLRDYVGGVNEFCTYDNLPETIKKIFERGTK